jgi:2'-5' RNA ligase
MSRIVSIELLLDAGAEECVREDWAHLAAAGLSSMAAHRAVSNRPHITVLVRPTLDPVTFSDAIARLPIPLTLGDPIVFRHGSRAVLARCVVPSDDLLAFHEEIHRIAPPGEDAPHTTPGNWVPHVTLVRRLEVASLPDALALLGGDLSGMAVGLRRWDSAAATVTLLG